MLINIFQRAEKEDQLMMLMMGIAQSQSMSQDMTGLPTASLQTILQMILPSLHQQALSIWQ